MSAYFLPVIRQRYLDANGNPLAGGKLYSYIAGTTTLAATYTAPDGLTPNANPVILDANGEANVCVGSGSYKFVLKDSSDNIQWTVDNVSVTTAATAASAWVEHNITGGQAATALTGETVDFASYSSAIYKVEIIRGTTIIANGTLSIQSVNGTGRVVLGSFETNEAHGVTFDCTQASTVATLRAAVSAGDNGTVKLKKELVPA